MPELSTEFIESLQNFKGIDFPGDIRFRQILVTGPPGAGKSTLIRRLGGWSEEGYLDLARSTGGDPKSCPCDRGRFISACPSWHGQRGLGF
jgi:predicted NACHT family NTPase